MADKHMFDGMEGQLTGIVQQVVGRFSQGQSESSGAAAGGQNPISEQNIASIAQSVIALLNQKKDAQRPSEDADRTSKDHEHAAGYDGSYGSPAADSQFARSLEPPAPQMPGDREQNFLSGITSQLGLPEDLSGRIMGAISSVMQNHSAQSQ